MAYQKKKSIVSLITGLLFIAAYCIFAYGRYRTGELAPDNMKAWAEIMLIFILIGIVASIIIQIVFHVLLSIGIAYKKTIANKDCADIEVENSIKAEIVEDEMDKLIGLKSMRISFIAAGTGIIAALVSLVLGSSPALMLNIVFLSFSLGSILEGIAQIYYYTKGI